MVFETPAWADMFACRSFTKNASGRQTSNKQVCPYAGFDSQRPNPSWTSKILLFTCNYFVSLERPVYQILLKKLKSGTEGEIKNERVCLRRVLPDSSILTG